MLYFGKYEEIVYLIIARIVTPKINCFHKKRPFNLILFKLKGRRGAAMNTKNKQPGFYYIPYIGTPDNQIETN